jgi:hypothetical protein
VADLLKEVLPVADTTNQETARAHLYTTAERMEQELGEERQLNLFEGSEEDGEQQPLPDGPITVGIDGGYVRAAHKQGWFEVIAAGAWSLSGATRRATCHPRSVSDTCKRTTRNRVGGCGKS